MLCVKSRNQEFQTEEEMKKLITVLMLFSLVFFGLSAAGQGEESSTEEETVIEPAPDVTLTIWSDETRSALLEELGAQFTEKYGVKIQVQQMGFGDIRDNIKVAAPAGEGADIIVGAHDWIGELITSGIIAPIRIGSPLAKRRP